MAEQSLPFSNSTNQFCTVSGCDHPQEVQDVCGAHYRRKRVWGDVRSDKPLRIRATRNHGLSHTPEYQTWRDIKLRCFNPNCRNYRLYGKRGISMCDEWRYSFEAFYDYIGPRPSNQHSLDRIDNNGNYEPGNIRWVIGEVQANNKRTNRLLTFRGKTQSLTLWAREMGLTPNCLNTRLNHGWKIETALTVPAESRSVTYKGKTQSVIKWVRELGLTLHPSAISQRIRKGFSVEQAFETPRLVKRKGCR